MLKGINMSWIFEFIHIIKNFFQDNMYVKYTYLQFVFFPPLYWKTKDAS